jgi:hypothetical protein
LSHKHTHTHTHTHAHSHTITLTRAYTRFVLALKRAEGEAVLKKQGSFVSRAMKSFRRKSDLEVAHVYPVQSPEKSAASPEKAEEHALLSPNAPAMSPTKVHLSKDAIAIGGSVMFREGRDSLASLPEVDLTRRPSAKFEASL